jgi:hypothetical protein
MKMAAKSTTQRFTTEYVLYNAEIIFLNNNVFE